MRFACGFWLYLILLLPVFWLGLRAADRRAATRLRLLLGPEASRHVEHADPRRRSWRRFLAFAGIFWLLLALARPQWGAREVSVTQRGSDIVVALDISNSMLAEDVPPNRMESAKGELTNFLNRLENSRVGLVFFAGSAFVQCPLTMDYGTAEIFLRMAGPDMMSEQGTAIGAALETSRQLLAKGRRGEKRGSFQAILLVTDGEDLEGSWEQAASVCAKEGIKVIPVGVGEETGGLIPVQDAQGRDAGFMKDEEGNLVMSRLDLSSLDKIAGMSGGSAFRLGVDGLAGDRLFAELQRLGRRDLEERRISAYQDRYFWPLLLGLLCFTLELLLYGRSGTRQSDDRAGRPVLRGRNLVAGLAFWLILATGVSGARAGIRPPGAAEAEEGRRLYLQEKYEEALERFQEAVVMAPDDPRISLALGETLFRLQRYEEAQAEFERALHLSEDRELKAEALYNSGTSDLAGGDPEQAAARFRESLKMVPDSPDALYNLEVALRRLQQQQQQQQQENQDQDKDKENDQQDQQENQDQQDQQDQEDQQDQKDQQDQQDQQENQEQENNQEQKQEQDQQQENQQENKEKEDQGKPEDELTREQAMQILKALDRDEEELKRSVQKRLRGGRPKSGKKW